MPTPEQIDTIRRLNDAARTHPGLASLANVTMGFQALSELDRFAALFAITRFTKFDGDNDPYGEHDFGAVYKLASGAWTQDRPTMQRRSCRRCSGRSTITTRASPPAVTLRGIPSRLTGC